MNSQIEAMQQALNALEYHTMQTRPIYHTDKAIEALRQAIEQAEKQEPVAWVESLEKPQLRCVTNLKYRSVAEVDAGVQFIPLYTASLNLKQDTNKVCEKLCAQARRTERGACHQIVWDYGFSRIDNEEVQAACVDLARAIQARGQNE